MKRVLFVVTVLAFACVGPTLAAAHPQLRAIRVGVNETFVTADAVTRTYDMEIRGNPKTAMTGLTLRKNQRAPMRPFVLSVSSIQCPSPYGNESCLQVKVLGRTVSSDAGVPLTEIYHFTYRRSGPLVEQGGALADNATAAAHGFPTNANVLSAGGQ